MRRIRSEVSDDCCGRRGGAFRNLFVRYVPRLQSIDGSAGFRCCRLCRRSCRAGGRIRGGRRYARRERRSCFSYIVPGEDDRASMPGFSLTDVGSFKNHTAFEIFNLCGYIRFRINQYGVKAGIIIGLPMEQENAGVGGYGDFNLVSNGQSAAAFEEFFSQKDFDMVLEFLFIFRRQEAVERHIFLDNIQPILREIPRYDSFSPPFFKPEHIFLQALI